MVHMQRTPFITAGPPFIAAHLGLTCSAYRNAPLCFRDKTLMESEPIVLRRSIEFVCSSFADLCMAYFVAATQQPVRFL